MSAVFTVGQLWRQIVDGFLLQVRTKDKFFDSISHLINYHWNNELPIISDESSLVLRHPVRRPKDQRPVT